MVRRLARDMKVEGRMAACGLLAVCYKKVSTTARSKQSIKKAAAIIKILYKYETLLLLFPLGDIRTTFRMLSQDRNPLVREAAAQKLGEMARVMESEYLRSFIMPIFVAVSRDKDVSQY